MHLNNTKVLLFSKNSIDTVQVSFVFLAVDCTIYNFLQIFLQKVHMSWKRSQWKWKKERNHVSRNARWVNCFNYFETPLPIFRGAIKPLVFEACPLLVLSVLIRMISFKSLGSNYISTDSRLLYLWSICLI